MCVFLELVLKTTMNCFPKVKQHDGITIVEKGEGEYMWMREWKSRALEKKKDRDSKKEREWEADLCVYVYVLAHKTNCGNETIQNKTKQKFKYVILKYCNYMSKWKCNQAMRNLIRLQWSNHSSNFTGWKFIHCQIKKL